MKRKRARKTGPAASSDQRLRESAKLSPQVKMPFRVKKMRAERMPPIGKVTIQDMRLMVQTCSLVSRCRLGSGVRLLGAETGAPRHGASFRRSRNCLPVLKKGIDFSAPWTAAPVRAFVKLAAPAEQRGRGADCGRHTGRWPAWRR